MSTEPKKTRNVNYLHYKLRHPLEDITAATAMAVGLKVACNFKVCKACTLRKAKKPVISKLAVVFSKPKGEYLFLY